jgi:D-sedoheptulose 7-phosphate isomerase
MFSVLLGFLAFPGFREVAMRKHSREGNQDAVARIRAVLEESARVKRDLARETAPEIAQAAEWIAAAYRSGGKTILFGNGGSAADAQHLAAEFTGRLSRDRPALPAIALTANTSELTAIGNDWGFEQVFSRLIEAQGEEGDVAIAISTSGNSPNLLTAVDEARARRLRTIALLGCGGGKLADRVDLALVVPSDDTQRIQESHITLAHAIAEVVESLLFPELYSA